MGFWINLIDKLKEPIGPKEKKEIEKIEAENIILEIEEETQVEKVKENIVDGKVAVVNGKVIVTNPQEGGVTAKIQPGKGIKILINGQEISKITPVLESDEIEILLDSYLPVREIQVKISLNQMEAYLDLNLKNGCQVTLEDQQPVNNLLLEGKILTIDFAPLSLEELKQFLQQEGVVFGLDETVLQEVIANPGKESFLVAQGKDYLPGVDAYIEKCYLEEGKEIPSVEEGDLVLVKHLPVPGEDGMTVTGKTIVAPPVKDTEIYVDKGLEISEDGLQAVATEAGRPIEKKGIFTIEPSFVINGDVDAASNKGLISFKGHLIIHGSVQEGLQIETGGDLQVIGGVQNSKILSGGTVKIQKSLIASQVSAGRFKLIYESITEKIRQLTTDTKNLLDSALQMKSKALNNSMKTVAEDKIIRIILSSHFPGFLLMLKEIMQEIEPIKKYINQELYSYFLSLEKYANNPPEKINDLPKLYQLLTKIFEHLDNYFASSPGDITGYYLQNSQLESSGNIYINGIGCYNSVLISNGEVRIDGKQGIFRGGKVVATENIYIKELGCPSGSPTIVEVPEDKRIEAELVYPGVLFKIGNKIHRNHRKAKKFDIYVDSDGELQVISLRADEADNMENTEVSE